MSETAAILDDKPKPTVFWVGTSLTCVWLLGVAVYSYFRWSDIVGQSPNAIGDTLAGITAPLAFLWLVVATFLQRHELELQRKELQLTRIEHKAARAVFSQQQIEMAVTAEQVKKQAESQIKILDLTISQKNVDLFEESIYTLTLLLSNCQDLYSIRYTVDGANYNPYNFHIHKIISGVAREYDRNNYENVLVSLSNNLESYKSSLNSITTQSGCKFFADSQAKIIASKYISLCDHIEKMLSDVSENTIIRVRKDALQIENIVKFIRESANYICKVEIHQ